MRITTSTLSDDRAVDRGSAANDTTRYGHRSDDDLGRLAEAGNTDAFDELISRHRDRIYTLALRSLGDEEQAGDVVCETFVAAFRSLGHGGRCSPGTWFHLHALRAVFARTRNGRATRYRVETRTAQQPFGGDTQTAA
jgi:DNA-directed RNA polymerase specialized sigma24 family protein